MNDENKEILLDGESDVEKEKSDQMIDDKCDNQDEKPCVDQEEENIHYTRCIRAFQAYRKSALKSIDICESNYAQLPSSHKNLLSDYTLHLEEARICIDRNAAFLKDVVDGIGGTFENSDMSELSEVVKPTSFELSKVKSTLKQVVRDWSKEGANEREACYDPIIAEVLEHKPLTDPQNEEIKVLVPGCGLGRLAWEFARRGYFSTGNEFSFFMLFVASKILNNSEGSSSDDYHQYVIHPWIEQSSNVISWTDTLRPVPFPDVWPEALPFPGRFSMIAGDFLEICNNQDEYDVVASCFFLDTAHNIISYLENIFHILKPGGILVNNGPLLYHFADIKNESSIELSYQDVINILPKIGFNIVKTDWKHSSYTCNKSSMMTYDYKCGFFVAQKPTHQTTTTNS